MQAQRNRLARSQSPYLLQHADNPVDWYPWGEEAFAEARASDRPIFLSIGYATCHWCHVMAHESFEDPIVAALMNEAFVNVKVDREERPDVDQVYMTVCQMLTGSGGWPLTVIMTPDRAPFFAGTYLPRSSRFGRLGMLELVPKVRQMWSGERQRLLDSAGEILGHLRALERRSGRGEVGPEVVDAAARELANRFDARHGGFGGAPKFPSPHTLLLLLQRWRMTGDRAALDMATATLKAMRRGGIFDQVGFGFHRYSTVPEWLIPHFEKMLYDQAMHLLAASEAWAATGDPLHEGTAREIVEYLGRDLTSADGALFSAEDADSEGEEGRFYVWSLDEVRHALEPEQAELAAAVWRLRPEGNWRDESTGELAGSNIPHLAAPLPVIAEQLGLAPAVLDARMATIRQKLLETRQHRVRPLRDDKVLADWNGLAAAALARAGRILEEPSFVSRAATAVDFVHARLRTPDGRLLHTFRENVAAVPAFLDDFACLTWADLELWDATFDPRHLARAATLLDETLERFWDHEGGGFHFVAADHEELLIRHRDAYDGAMPSGNSIAMWNLLRLGRLLGRPQLEERAAEVARAFANDLRRAPSGHAHMIGAVAAAHAPSLEVVIVGAAGDDGVKKLLAAARSGPGPEPTVVLILDGPTGDAVRRLLPWAADHRAVDGRATAYPCRGFVCRQPTSDPAELGAWLRDEGARR